MNTPIDTTRYLLLGTAALAVPLLGYILSLALRIHSTRKQLDRINSVGMDQPPN